MLAYAYHCCAFLPFIPSNPPPPARVKDIVVFPDEDDEIDPNIWNSSVIDLWPQMRKYSNLFTSQRHLSSVSVSENISHKLGKKFKDLWDRIGGSDFTYPGNFPSYVDEYPEDDLLKSSTSDIPPGKIQCLPLPGPFLPCQDLFDWWTLRCGVWLVFLCAMLGNGTVVFVLVFSRSKMDVPRFLVCNLAAADFFMGIYLG